uniref:Uncharacterized protein n=1 Tax=Aspergillus fumigatus TaxID=746128 RepID=Q6MY79_ASPFM|nr:hypothetical protein AfA33H4.070c [Aspergillus fumigatus]
MPFCAIQSFAKDLLCAFHIFMSRLRRVGLEPSEVIFLSPGSSLEDQGLRFSFVHLYVLWAAWRMGERETSILVGNCFVTKLSAFLCDLYVCMRVRRFLLDNHFKAARAPRDTIRIIAADTGQAENAAESTPDVRSQSVPPP